MKSVAQFRREKPAGLWICACLTAFFSVAIVPIVLAAAVSGQTSDKIKALQGERLAFDVVSIHLSDPNNDKQSMSVAPGKFEATISLRELIKRSYDLKDFQLVGLPRWADSAKYDIVAKDADTTDPSTLSPDQQDRYFEEQLQRLQSLLADRFGFRFHIGRKSVPVLLLVQTKGGAKLDPPKAGEMHRLYSQGPGQLACYSTSMDELASELSEFLPDQIVLNRTNLTGRYDFVLRWTPDDLKAGATGDASSAEATFPTLYTALQEQIGLRVESQRAPVDVLMVDGINRPTPD